MESRLRRRAVIRLSVAESSRLRQIPIPDSSVFLTPSVKKLNFVQSPPLIWFGKFIFRFIYYICVFYIFIPSYHKRANGFLVIYALYNIFVFRRVVYNAESFWWSPRSWYHGKIYAIPRRKSDEACLAVLYIRESMGIFAHQLQCGNRWADGTGRCLYNARHCVLHRVFFSSS